MAIPAQNTASENNFIVRVYRRDERNPLTLIGVVEDAGGGANQVKLFRTAEELISILIGRKYAACCSTGEPAKIPVIVKGRDLDNRPFSENTLLAGLTPEGASLAIKSRVAPDSTLLIYIAPVRSGPGIKATVVSVTGRSSSRLKQKELLSSVSVSFDFGRI